MHRDIVAELRDLAETSDDRGVQELARVTADAIESLLRGLAAQIERVERLEAQVLPAAPDPEIGLP